MRRKSFLLPILALLLALPALHGQAKDAKPDDKPKADDTSVTKPTADFNEIHFASPGPGKLLLRKADKCGFAVKTPKGFVGKPVVQVNGIRLMILVPGGMPAGEPVEYIIDVKDLKWLTLSSAGKAEVEGIDSKELQISVTGTGSLVASGKAQSLNITMSNAGNFEGKRLESKKIVVSHAGTGKALVNATELLEVNMTGKGLVEYVGAPMVKKSILGAGKVVKVED